MLCRNKLQNLYVGKFKYSLPNLHKPLNTRKYATFDNNTWICSIFTQHRVKNQSLTHTVSRDKIQCGHRMS